MNLEEFAQLMGKTRQEAEEMLKGEEIVTLNLREKKTAGGREQFNMELIQ
jgi:hypothetical protein